MDGDAEITPTDPSQDNDENALGLLGDNLERARRSVRALQRDIRSARPEGRTAVVANAAEFGRDFLPILRDNIRILDQISRREADTVRDLKAVTSARPRGWFSYVVGGVAALSGPGAAVTWAANHPNASFVLSLVFAGAAYLANTPVPWMRREGDRRK